MKERGILFSAPMVRAILDGTKTQTRRAIKPEPPTERRFPGSVFGLSRCIADGVKMYSLNDYGLLPKHPTDFDLIGSVAVARSAGYTMRYRCPYGAPGDRLWVRETWGVSSGYDKVAPSAIDWENRKPKVAYFATDSHIGVKARPSLFMPRLASRITLEITEVRAQRLQDITEEDAVAEGCKAWKGVPGDGDMSAVQAYARLWESINGAGSWGLNPWVWAVSFKKVDGEVAESLTCKGVKP